MLRSAQTFFAPDDVSVPCRVRHSEIATDRQFTDTVDMTCTMRVWHKTSERPKSIEHLPMAVQSSLSQLQEGSYGLVSSKTTKNKKECQPGPQLILTPISNVLVESQQQQQQQHLLQMCCSADFGDDPIPLSDRFLSFGSVDNAISNRSGRGGTGGNGARSPRASFASFIGTGALSVCDNNDNNNTSATRTATTPRRKLGTTTIPVWDIMMMNTTSGGGNERGSSSNKNKRDPSQTNRIDITTTSSGFFELTMDSTNEREVVIAFLKASMPKDRVVMGGIGGGTAREIPSSRTRSSSTHNAQSFDVEAFTATRMSERLKSESLTEKVQRRIHRIVASLDEISSSITECVCACDKNSSVTPVPNHHDQSLERRDPPSRQEGGVGDSKHNTTSPFNYDRVEMAEPITPVRISPPRVTLVSSSSGGAKYTMPVDDPSAGRTTTTAGSLSRAKKADMLRQSHMPSGLSVESDPELDKTSVF